MCVFEHILCVSVDLYAFFDLHFYDSVLAYLEYLLYRQVHMNICYCHKF